MDVKEAIDSAIARDRLRWLGLFHYVSGSLTLAFSLMFTIQLVFFSAIFSIQESMPDTASEGNEALPLEIFDTMICIFGALVVCGWIYGVLEIVSGYFIRSHRNRIFCFVVSIPRLLLMPYGTMLSIFTLILLEDPVVQALYEEERGHDYGA